VTGREAMADARQRLEAAGVPEADASAMALLSHAFGWESVAQAHRPELLEALPPEVASRFEGAITARLARQPVSQIRGWRHFWKHRFRVTPDVLDPRPETETLVATALEAPFASVLDLGTGSGAILLSLMAERPNAQGTGTDLSPAALDVARANAADFGLARAVFLQSDWFAGVTGRFDLIVSNPPYIAASEMAGLDPEVREWEPHLALTPGPDPLVPYQIIASGALAHLAPGGRLLVEIGPTLGPSVAAIFNRAGLCDVRILPDLDGRDRVVGARAPAEMAR